MYPCIVCQRKYYTTEDAKDCFKEHDSMTFMRMMGARDNPSQKRLNQYEN